MTDPDVDVERDPAGDEERPIQVSVDDDATHTAISLSDNAAVELAVELWTKAPNSGEYNITD